MLVQNGIVLNQVGVKSQTLRYRVGSVGMANLKLSGQVLGGTCFTPQIFQTIKYEYHINVIVYIVISVWCRASAVLLLFS